MKKILATLIAVVLGAGLSLVAVAAPVSAHTPEVRIDCGSVTYKFTSYGNGSNNVFQLYVDDLTTPVVTETFGNNLGQKTYTFDGTTSHSIKYTIDASDGGSTYDVISPVTVTTPCTYPAKSLDTTCDAVAINWGGKLDNSIHIHVKVEVGGTSKQVHAEFDYNIPGGYGPNKLGVRFKDWNGVQTAAPLTEQQVKSGRFTFEFPAYLPGGTTSYTVQWVQFNELHFNQDENPAKWMLCGYTEVTVQAEPSATPPTCDTDGTLVVPAQAGIVWSGGADGAGPGTYTLVASAAEGYELTAPYSIELTVLPADASLCAMDPKASVHPGTCVPVGDISQKPVLFTFDNRGSELPVTFTIPGIDGFAPVVVPAGAVSDPVPGPDVDHLTGGSWDVYADGAFLVTLVVDPFEQCQDELVPAEPIVLPGECAAGELAGGSITIVPSPGRIVYTITGGPGDVALTVNDDAPKTTLPAGDYQVTAHGINGFKVGPENTWTRSVVVEKPAGCALTPDHPTLPTTGGTGTPHLVLAGATLLLVGAGLYFARRRLAAAK